MRALGCRSLIEMLHFLMFVRLRACSGGGGGFYLDGLSLTEGGTPEGAVVLELGLGQLLGKLGLDSHLELVVDEGDDHAVEQGDQVRGLMVLHLLVALHEHEGAV